MPSFSNGLGGGASSIRVSFFFKAPFELIAKVLNFSVQSHEFHRFSFLFCEEVELIQFVINVQKAVILYNYLCGNHSHKFNTFGSTAFELPSLH